jgi:hypothetical protein
VSPKGSNVSRFVREHPSKINSKIEKGKRAQAVFINTLVAPQTFRGLRCGMASGKIKVVGTSV